MRESTDTTSTGVPASELTLDACQHGSGTSLLTHLLPPTSHQPPLPVDLIPKQCGLFVCVCGGVNEILKMH